MLRIEDTVGPHHEGYAVTCEVMGAYVTIVSSKPDVATAVACMVSDRGPYGAEEAALVGRVPWRSAITKYLNKG